LLVVVTLAVAAPLSAHHSFGAEYDVNQPVSVSGVVTKIEWTNPHSFVFVDVTDGSGTVTNWKFEGYPPNALYRTGWKRDVTMKPGDKVTVTGWRARLGGNLAHSREIMLPGGNKLFFGPPAGTGDGGNAPAVKVP
jgi:DNA/RNA endonuclease YhcR with UshA esterase domain